MNRWRAQPSAGQAIEAYVGAVDAGIPRALRYHRGRMLRELADGLDDATRTYATLGLDADRATERAVAESGPARVVADAFTAQLAAMTARLTTIVLLASGPVIGLLWASALAPGRPPPEMLVVIPPLGPVIAVSVVFCMLTLLATGPARFRPRRLEAVPQRLAATAWAVAGLGDLLILATAAVALLAGAHQLVILPACVAASLSLCRAAAAQHLARHQLAGRHP